MTQNRCPACQKRLFETRFGADRAARISMDRARVRKRRAIVKAYRCPAGCGWHIGHGTPGRVKVRHG